jgi:hypothetical protein
MNTFLFSKSESSRGLLAGSGKYLAQAVPDNKVFPALQSHRDDL